MGHISHGLRRATPRVFSYPRATSPRANVEKSWRDFDHRREAEPARISAGSFPRSGRAAKLVEQARAAKMVGRQTQIGVRRFPPSLWA
jgi:hypothetical protein